MTDNNLIMSQARGGLSNYLNPGRVEAMNEGWISPSPELIKEDQLLFEPNQHGIQLIPLTKDTEIDENDRSKLYLVFSIEGCHTLSETLDAALIDNAKVLANLDELAGRLPVVSINLTHLVQYPFCNHAYGMQFVPADSFRPKGKGITQEGSILSAIATTKGS
jgi:hypothetical protein